MRTTLVLGAMLMLSVAACGGDDSADAPGVASPAEPSLEQCRPVPEDVMTALESGLTLEGAALPVGFAVESPSFPGVFYIAAELDGPGYEAEGDAPVWVAESLSLADITVDVGFGAVNELAESVSSWDNFLDRDFSTFGEGIRLAGACVLVDAGLLDPSEL